MPRRIIVTGGAGFVGSAVCRALRAAGDDVIAVDNLQNGIRDNVPDGVSFVPADVAEPGLLDAFRGTRLDAVIHCAAQSSNTLSFRDPHLDVMTNQVGTLNMLTLCAKSGIPRLLFTSSMSVYGEAARLPTPESEPVRPLSPYAVHKAASEAYLQLLAPAAGVQATIFRLYTTYGPGQNLANRDQGLVSIYLSYLLRGEPILVRGSAERRRDIVYVDDAVQALVSALDAPATYGRTYNVGTGEAPRIGEILQWLIAAAGSPADYPISYEAATPGDPHATQADISALARDLGWRPRIGAAEGIARTVRAYFDAPAPTRP